MHFGNGFVNAVFVLLSKNTVVLDVVHRFLQEEGNDYIAQIEFERFPSEEVVNRVEDALLKNLIPGHFVVDNSCE